MSRRHGKSPSPSAITPLPRLSPWRPSWVFAGIFLCTLLVYWPALSGGFLWDDDGHVTRADLRDLTGLFRIWFEFGATQQYYPVLHSAFWTEHLLWGDSALGYHLLNVLLHASAAYLFYTLLRRLAVPGAELAAVLFAVHPVCVESVAWISEQKNTLSLVFYLCAALSYFRYAEQRVANRYTLATGFFVLALLTKTVTASLPAALLVVQWWQHGKLQWRRNLLPLFPWLVLGAVSGLATTHFERELIGAQGQDFDLGLVERCLLAGRVVWFYLGKLLWPVDLIFIYPRWTVDASQWWQWLFPLAGITLLAGLVWWQRRQRGPLAVVLLFAGSLFPVLGFVNVYPFLFSYVADHFQYLASLAIFALAGAGLTKAASRIPPWGPRIAGGLLLAGLASLSWSQTGMYRDKSTLFQTTLEKNPSCWMAHNNLAISLADAGRVELAILHLSAALKLHPDFPEALNNLGDNLTRVGRAREAIPYLERALVLQPQYFQAHGNLGTALLAASRIPEAIKHYEQALAINPRFAAAERNLGVALATAGQINEAVPHFARAAQIQPNFADAEVSWAMALAQTNHFPEALAHFERAVSLDPESAFIRSNYAQALVEVSRYPEAIVQYEAAVRLEPENAVLQMNLALGLRQVGRLNEAAEHYLEAVRLNPAMTRQP